MDDFYKHCLMHIDPFMSEDEVLECRMINEFDVLFVFKDGRRIIFDSDTNYFWGQFAEGHILTKEQIAKEFSSRLRTMMRRACIDQEYLAEALGTKQPVVSRYVTGDSIPSYVTVVQIADILGCSMDDFRYKRY
jgi:hypothetical protein